MPAYDPNANWTARIADATQSPIYYVAFDGLSTHHYSTGPVKAAGVTKKEYLQEPVGGGATLDMLAGIQTIQRATFEILDVLDDVTDLISTDTPGGRETGSLTSLVNRGVTIYAGDASLIEADYAPVFTGRVTGLRMNSSLTGYIFTASSNDYLLDGMIMENATSVKWSKIRGNVVNVFWSIMTGTFDTGHQVFPLDFVSVDSGGSSVPTGLGIATSLIDRDGIVAERDRWHSDDIVELQLRDPVNAKDYLQTEFFRVFQCFPAISGDGRIGLKFHVPAGPISAAETLIDDDIISVDRWTSKFVDHLNKFKYLGDYDDDTANFDTVLYDTTTSEDTADRTDTKETIELLVESQWLRTAPLTSGTGYQGVIVAEELAGRMRLRYRHPPVEIDVSVLFTKRNLTQGLVISVTQSDIPDLFTGARGVTAKLMTIIGIAPDYKKGVIALKLLDTGIKRYGVISPSGTAVYGSATNVERNTFAWIGHASDNHVGTADPGYYLL